MLKTLLLAAPVFVTLFWSMTLQLGQRQKQSPQAFLGKFMSVAFIVYLSHFLFFTPLPRIYMYVDPLYQYAMLLVYPLFHIYIRLLTIDSKWSFAKHGIYLAAPTILVLLYLVGISWMSRAGYEQLLFGDGHPTTLAGGYQRTVVLLIKITFLIQVIFTVWKNSWLLRTYKHKAGQYYSDIENSRIYKATILNIAMLITACTSLILGLLGRHFFAHELTGIILASVIFSSMLFTIGLLGYRQVLINPTFEKPNKHNKTKTTQKIPESKQQELQLQLQKVIGNKIYLNASLTIHDLASAIGSNRTYISNYINGEYKTSFSAYINSYRVKELQAILEKEPHLSLENLADMAGFGCVDSLKRAVKNETGLGFNEWRKEIQSTDK